MNIIGCYQLVRNVTIRPERFGALVYNYDNRQLYFIHSHLVADFLTGLDGARPLGEAVEDFVAQRALPASAADTLLDTVGKLERMGIVKAVAEQPKTA
jgi:putative mycofactocin binding protein MftB